MSYKILKIRFLFQKASCIFLIQIVCFISSLCVYVLLKNHFIAVCYQCAKKKKKNKRSQRTEKIEPYVFFEDINISTHTYKETQKKRERDKATVCLARPTKREKKR